MSVTASSAPQPGKNVALNEYRTWTQEDRHAQAYRTLELPESKRIAANLGLPSATTAKICLDCHADNVPGDKRGPKFQMSDGVSCEACHGGAEKWLESHAAESATHKDNVARGMYPTELPLQRAQVCLSCHLGTRDRFATHAIMGAGHPRLSFELEAYTTNQPAHYVVDADYVRRKGKIEGMNLWLTGQIESTRRMLSCCKRGCITAAACSRSSRSTTVTAAIIRWTRSAGTPQRAGAGHQAGYAAPADAEPDRAAGRHGNLRAAGAARAGPRLTHALIRAGQRIGRRRVCGEEPAADWVRKRDELTRSAYSNAEVTTIRKSLAPTRRPTRRETTQRRNRSCWAWRA